MATTVRSRFRTNGRNYTQLIFVSIVVISCFSGISAAPSSTEDEVCPTPRCKDIADELLSGMDTTINPCTDFYKYVCGNWHKKHSALTHSPKWSHFGIIANKTNNRLREILETGWIETENTAVRKAKQLYRACMDTNTIENKGILGILNFIDLTGGWPIIMSPVEWQKTRKSWQTVDSQYNVIAGSSPIVNLVVSPDLKSSKKNVLRIVPPSPYNTSPVPLFNNVGNSFAASTVNETVEDPYNYKGFIKEIVAVVARTRGIVIDENQLEKDAQGISEFEAYLRHIKMKAVTVNQQVPTFDVNSLQRSTTIAEFQTFYDSSAPKTPSGKIDWLKRIKEVFAQTDSVTIDSSETVVVHAENYFKLLSHLLDHTSERDIVNTIQWWFVVQTLSYTNQEMIEILEKYSTASLTTVATQPQSPPRWLKCVTENQLQHPLASAYVQKYFSENAKNTALDMLNEIEIEMGKEIARSEWLDEDSKSSAKEKIAYMTKFIGYPEWYEKPEVLNERYVKLSIGSFYLENMLLVKRFALLQQLESLRKPVDKWTWIASPTAINAFYAPAANSLTFPAGILQMPFFDADYPDAVNYGGIGSIIGHEMSHGFDNLGSQFDKDGNAVQWWSNNTIFEYQKRSQCFIDQFNNYRLIFQNVEYRGLGYYTLGENIADSTGVRAAFEALKTHISKPGYKHITLPGLKNLSTEKLFFVSYAGSMCDNVKPEFILSLMSTDPHSPSPVRVVGTLSNMEGFSETFKCPKGSVMNPSKKCGIWH